MTEDKAFCPGCPRRGVFMALAKLKFPATGDVVCHLVGARPPRPRPLPQGAPGVGPGGGSNGAGPNGAPGGGPQEPRPEVLLIDGATLLNGGSSLLRGLSKNDGGGMGIILDDGTLAAVRGEQDVDLPGLCRGVGIARVRAIDAFSVKEIGDVLLEEADAAEASVLIAQAPCTMKFDVKRPTYRVDPDKCEGCEHCLKVECSAMRVVAGPGEGTMVEIVASECAGCGICMQLCKHDAILAPTTR